MEYSDSISVSMSKGSLVEDFDEPSGAEEGLLSEEQDIISNERIRPDDELLGIYKVTSDPIEGGMGSVWRVCEEVQDIELAMKRPQPKFFAEGSRKRKENFIRECESWIGLGLHPNIVACYYVREIGGVPTIFSEWMKGGSLENRIEDGKLYEGSEGEIEERLLHIAIQMAQGLHYAHEKGLIHQDMKRDNVLLSENMEAKMADFGLSGAKAALADDTSFGMAGETDGTVSENAEGMTVLKGSGGYTPAYCSPEQIGGKLLGRRTDIYSWAASVLEMYLGERPWKKGPDAGKDCAQYLTKTRVEMPEAWKALLIRCLSEDENIRPRDFAEIRQELLAIYRQVCGKEYDGEDGTAASDSADSLNNQAVSYMELGMEERAKKCWEEAQKVDPSHAEALYNRSLIDWREGAVTGRGAWHRLLSHPYYYRTEEGKAAVETMAKESGKKTFDAPLFSDEEKHVLEGDKIGLKHYSGTMKNYTRYLWHGQLYLMVPHPAEAEGKDPLLYIYDAQTGSQLAKESFPEFAQMGKEVRNSSLSEDCRYVFFTTKDHFAVSYDRQEKCICHTVELETSANSMYDTPFPFRAIGKEGRFVWRSVSHGAGHGAPPTAEVYDLKTGKCLEIKNAAQGQDTYSDRQLMMAGADGAIGEPEGPRFARSLTDGCRMIPVIAEGEELFRCDMDGTPVAPVSSSIVQGIYGRLGNFQYATVRVCADGKVWMIGREGLMNYDVFSGKCLRSFPYDLNNEAFLIDEDGLGILRLSVDKDANTVSWQYKKLAVLDKEDQASWVMAKLESFEEYKDRLEKLKELEEEFNRAQKQEDLCRIYAQAETIHRFFGSPAHRSMTGKLAKLCRQKDGFVYEAEDLELWPREEENRALLEPFDVRFPVLPEPVNAALERSEWIFNRKNPHISPDGKRALLVGTDATMSWKDLKTGALNEKSVSSPCGSGIYLLDIPSVKMYFVRSIPVGTRPVPHAGFNKDKNRLIFQNLTPVPGQRLPKYELGFADLNSRDSQAVLAAEGKGPRNLTVTASPADGTTGPSILWNDGIFTFTDEESAREFIESDTGLFHILDADETYGLIAYMADLSFSEKRFRVWSTDEGRTLLELPYEVRTARFSRSNEDGIKLLISVSDLFHPYLREKAKVRIYQFSCGYAPLPKRRHEVPIPKDWPQIMLSECEWKEAPSGGVKIVLHAGAGKETGVLQGTTGSGRSERELDKEAFALSRVKTAENLSKAHELYCELAERFPEREGHGKNRSITEAQLKNALRTVALEKKDETLKIYYEMYCGLADKNPDKDYYRSIRDSAESHYAYALSQSKDLEKKERAYELFKDLAERHPEDPLHAKNRDITEGQITALRFFSGNKKKKEKEGGGPADKPDGEKKRFSLFNRRK